MEIGRSAFTWLDPSNVVGAGDRSYLKADGPIHVDFFNHMRSSAGLFTFVFCAFAQHDFVPPVAGVINALRILCFIIFPDELLFVLSDALPIGSVLNGERHVTAED